MTLVFVSLAILAVGTIVPLVLVRAPRAGLALSMAAILAAAMFVLVAAVQVLLGIAPGDALNASWPLPLGAAHFALDGLSAWFLVAIGLLEACVAIYTPAYMRSSGGRTRVPLFGALMCLLMASLVLVVCAADAIVFLIGWELLSLTAFFLISFDHDRVEVRRGAWMYLVATHIGTAICVFPLFAILYAQSHTTAFADFSNAMESASQVKLITVFALAVIGFGTKAGFLPMHVWLPAAHPVAPTPVSALLSGVVVKIGIYGLLRLLTWLPPLPPVCGQALLAIGVASGVMGVLYALAQHDVKRLLAYHTVENIGIIAIGIGVGMLGQAADQPAIAALGYAGVLLHVVNHALFKGLLFLSAGAVLHGTGTVDIERLGGLARKTPVNAMMFLLGAVAICGLPPLNGFISEWVIYGALFTSSIHVGGAPALVPALGILSLALMGGLALACFAKVFAVVFLGEPRDAAVEAHSTPAAMKVAMAILALLCLVLGVLPGLWMPMTFPAVSALTRIPASEIGPAFETVLAPAIRLTFIACVFICIVVALMLLRRLARAKARRTLPAGESSPVATWGCGYAYPNARMQYSATSFAFPLISSFRSLLWPERKLVAPDGPFPSRSHVETHAPDLAQRELFEPVFRGVSRFFTMIRTVSWTGAVSPVPMSEELQIHGGPIQSLTTGIVGAFRRGAIQVYLLFIVLTLIVLFLWEGFFASSVPQTAEPQAAHASAVAEVRR
jgi:formate hydrogenlyase subunit 3/multisubunit Na+/H+ antiporter MnhD subunit